MCAFQSVVYASLIDDVINCGEAEVFVVEVAWWFQVDCRYVCKLTVSNGGRMLLVMVFFVIFFIKCCQLCFWGCVAVWLLVCQCGWPVGGFSLILV